MASRAIVVEIILLVIRIRSRGKVTLMAVETQARCIGVAACVTGNTGQRGVSTGQVEARLAVIKIRRLPD